VCDGEVSGGLCVECNGGADTGRPAAVASLWLLNDVLRNCRSRPATSAADISSSSS